MMENEMEIPIMRCIGVIHCSSIYGFGTEWAARYVTPVLGAVLTDESSMTEGECHLQFPVWCRLFR